MANEVTLRIGADPTKLKNGLKQSSAAIDSFGSKARASIARVGSSFKGLADRMVTPFTSLVLGGSMGMAIKNVGDLSESLMYYGMAAKKSDADTKVFRESLHKTAVETGVAANEILQGVSKIGEITGDFDYSEQMGGTLAKAAKASGASVEDLSNVAASLKATMGLTADEVGKFFNSLIIQGDQGSFTLEKFARVGKGLLASSSSFGIKSAEQFASFGGYLQLMNAQIKSEEELTTSVAALFGELIQKSDKLKKIGVNVVDSKGAINDFDAIMHQLMTKTDGDIRKISTMFGASSLKALQPVMAEYKNGWQTLDTITKSGMEGMTNTNVLEERYKKASSSFNGSIGKMKAIAEDFADTALAEPVEYLADALGYVANNAALAKTGLTVLASSAGLLALIKVASVLKDGFGMVKGLKNIWSKKSGDDATASALDSLSGSVQKVFVVNMGGGMGNANYMDDDLPAPIKQSTETIAQTTKEVGRFRQGLSNARAGLNKIGSSPLGMSIMGAATSWAMGQIYNFGSAFMEWRSVVANSTETARQTIDTNAKSFEERYGKNAHAKRYDETLKAINDEENSFMPSQKKLEKLYSQLNVSRELMKRDIADGSQRVTAKDYMQQFTVAPNIVINLDASNNRFTAQSDGGKPAKVKVKNTPGF